ncbi:MAG: hypothetical protein L0Y48_02375 [Fusobacteria bacterium]|nr:hypothetical protein [Fusobacteriota bacterium]
MIAQEASFSSGFGKNDTKVALPFYLVKERLYSALTQILLVGGEYPSYGLINVQSEDKGIIEEVCRCFLELGNKLDINFDFNIQVVKSISTSFIISLYSFAELEDLKLNKTSEGQWIYLAKLKNEKTSFEDDLFFELEFIKDIASSKGISESYLLRDESINKGLKNLMKTQDCFFIEGNHSEDTLKKFRRGTGLLIISPYKLLRTDDKSVEIQEIGSVFNKSI